MKILSCQIFTPNITLLKWLELLFRFLVVTKMPLENYFKKSNFFIQYLVFPTNTTHS